MPFDVKKALPVAAVVCLICIFGVVYLLQKSKASITVAADAGQQLNVSAEPSAIPSVEPPNGSIAAEPAASGTIKVYINGAVKRPGVYELAEGSRVEDALKAAGGITEEADTRAYSAVNQAAYLTDAQQIYIPTTADGAAPPPAAPDASEPGTGLVNINTADKATLMTLPGVGTVTAENILRYREESGPFQTIEDLKNVNRIGDKTFDALKQFITVD